MEEGVIHQSLASSSMVKNHQQSLARPQNQIGDLPVVISKKCSSKVVNKISMALNQQKI